MTSNFQSMTALLSGKLAFPKNSGSFLEAVTQMTEDVMWLKKINLQILRYIFEIHCLLFHAQFGTNNTQNVPDFGDNRQKVC